MSDSFPTVVTKAGRTLRADGGVFPDLVIEDDTLTTVEQNLLVESARAQIPLTLRITEFAFEQVRMAKAGTGPEELAPETIEPFFDLLEEEGLSAEIMADPEARDYPELASQNGLRPTGRALRPCPGVPGRKGSGAGRGHQAPGGVQLSGGALRRSGDGGCQRRAGSGAGFPVRYQGVKPGEGSRQDPGAIQPRAVQPRGWKVRWTSLRYSRSTWV